MSEEIIRNRKALEEFLLDIDILDQVETKVLNFNAFETMGIIHTEIRHSNVLSWLLTPTENHGLGDYIIKKVIQSAIYHNFVELPELYYDPLQISLMDYHDFVVRREWQNIDVIAVSEKNKFVVVIENKVWSNESNHQLKKYFNIVQNEYKDYKQLFIFLTPLGDESSNPDTWLSMNYNRLIHIIEKAIVLKKESISERVLLFIIQYIEIVRRYIVGDNELEKVCREIYYKHKKALDLIFEYKPDIYSDISNDLQDFIRTTPELILDDSNKTYIRFTTKQLDKYIEKNGKGWTSTKRLLLFEFQNRGNKLVLKLIIGPGENDSRRQVYDIADNNKAVFNGQGGKLGAQFTQIFSKEFLPKHFDEESDYDKIRKQVNAKFQQFIEKGLVKIHESLSQLKQDAE